MGIDIKSLPPQYQAQIAKKLIQNQQVKAKKSRSKYRNTPTVSNGIRFASKAEEKRYQELMLLLKAGKISNLKLQHTITLQEAFTTPEGERVRARTYKADFSYCDSSGNLVYEDVKSPGTRTRVYENKRKELLERGIKIKEVIYST